MDDSTNAALRAATMERLDVAMAAVSGATPAGLRDELAALSRAVAWWDDWRDDRKVGLHQRAGALIAAIVHGPVPTSEVAS